MQHEPIVPVAYRAPFDFSGKCWIEHRPPGSSVLDIVASCPVLPPNFHKDGYVCINNEIVPREMWALVRPKATRAELPIAVTMHLALQNPRGGGGGGGKQTFQLVAALALIVVTTAITAGAFGPEGLALAGSYLAAGSTSAQLLAGAVAIGGALAISALSGPPISAAGVDAGGTNAEQAEAAAASGNILDRGGSIPRVIGTRKVFPPLACEPVVELVDQDEVVEALYILNGPHKLEDIRIDGGPLVEAEDIEFETREGWPSDTQQSLITRQGRTITPSLELSDTSVQGDGQLLSHQSLPETDLPVWHGVASRSSPDEIWLHLLFPGGIYPGSNTYASVPLRIRFRMRGDTAWINLPELYYEFNATNQRRVAILLKWQAAELLQDPPASSSAGFWAARLNTGASAQTPATPPERQWTADSYFDDGAGVAYLINGNTATTRLRNINLFDNRCEVYLDENTFPKGIYEIQIKRGTTLVSSSFSISNMGYSGFVGAIDPFWYFSSGGFKIFQNHSNFSDRVLLTRVVSIWNEPPLTRSGEVALVALTALNRSVRQLSIKASGYVQDWDGSDWTAWTTSSNPAPHYRDVLSGSQNLDPLPDDLRDDDALVAWRVLCRDNNWTCDAIINDTRTQDVLNLLASCAYARPYQSDIYSIVVDNDRTADAPVQVFSRRNSANLHYEKAFARLPAGFNVTYRDESLDDDQAQTTVYQRDLTNTDLTLLESVAYDGIIDVDKVEARALFDLDQAALRSTFYYMDVDIESIVCRRGSLVALEHDILTSRSGDGYIASKQLSGGSPVQITGITLDAEIDCTNELDMHAITDMHAIADMHAVGIKTGVAIRRTDGTISIHQLSNVTGSTNVLTFSTPFTDVSTIQGFADNDRKYGCLVVAGDMSTVYRRMLVQSISPSKDFQASMALVDEAPSLVRFAGAPLLQAMDDLTQLNTMEGGADTLEFMS